MLYSYCPTIPIPLYFTAHSKLKWHPWTRPASIATPAVAHFDVRTSRCSSKLMNIFHQRDPSSPNAPSRPLLDFIRARRILVIHQHQPSESGRDVVDSGFSHSTCRYHTSSDRQCYSREAPFTVYIRHKITRERKVATAYQLKAASTADT